MRGFDAVASALTSPLRRARRICELAGHEAPAEIGPDLAEWDYGDFKLPTRTLVRKRTDDRAETVYLEWKVPGLGDPTRGRT